MTQHRWSNAWIRNRLRQLATRQLLQPEQSFHPDELQPHLLLSGFSLLFYRLGLVFLGGLLLGSFFGLLYGPSATVPVLKTLALPSLPEQKQGWDAVWPIVLPQLRLWALLSWLAGVGFATFGLMIGVGVGSLDRIRTVGKLRWAPNRIAVVLGVTVAIALLFLQMFPPAMTLGIVLALLPNLLWFGGIKMVPSVSHRSPWRHWLAVVLINGLIGLLLVGEAILSIRLWTLRFDFSFLPWPLSIQPLGTSFLNAIAISSYGSSVGLVFVLRSSVVSTLFTALQRQWLRGVLALTGQLPWNQGIFWQQAIEAGYLHQVENKFRITDFRGLMEQD